MHGTPPDGLDQRWLRVVNSFARHTPWLHAVMSGYATYGVVVLAALLVAGWQVARRSGQPALIAGAMWAPAAAIAAAATVPLIAAYVAEARPYASMSGLLVLAHRSTGFSYPSGHATMAGAVAAGLFMVHRRLGLIAAAAALLLAFAGVYTAAHYPDDVTAGLILGMTVTLAGHGLLEGPLTRLAAGLLRRREGRPVTGGPGWLRQLGEHPGLGSTPASSSYQAGPGVTDGECPPGVCPCDRLPGDSGAPGRRGIRSG
jgi:undecaprenyl-diphosphatase